MNRECDCAYSLRREKAERLAAERAMTPAARDIHNTLADRYAAVARSHRDRAL